MELFNLTLVGKIRLTLYVVLFGLFVAIFDIAAVLAFVASRAESSIYWRFDTSILRGLAEAEKRDKYEIARSFGRLSRLRYTLSDGARALLNPQPSRNTTSTTKSTWDYAEPASYTDDDVGYFVLDVAHTQARYINSAVVGWMVPMTVILTTHLVRKISHSQRAGLPRVGSARRPLVVFTRCVVPGQLVFIALYAVEVFLGIFQDDVSLDAFAGVIIVEGISTVVSTCVGFGMSVWAVGRILDQVLSTVTAT
ncbi:hypothetical protein QBC37DRAFT_404040 [Rhypophila decipiens]|uniref:Uncharacterized protein n=1 Tax=Rhypophila decipiens TaxID=261697 RepID=A0AAN6Y1Q9_9PEZI|nr:hypothetical protein QBC37DRAFT_404040 [Rhypophila decipiens]